MNARQAEKITISLLRRRVRAKVILEIFEKMIGSPSNV
jgi:hypothetical protein